MSIVSVFKAFDDCRATTSRTQKEALLRKVLKTDKALLQQIVKYTYNPNWNYRITAPKDAQENIGVLPALPAFAAFINILDDCRLGIGELADVRTRMRNLLGSCAPGVREYLCAILDRELKIGFRQWNKFFKDAIPSPRMMLCDTWDTVSVSEPMYCEPKLDGLRMQVVVDHNGDGIVISRGGKPLWNVDHILQEIKKMEMYNAVLDGEVYAGNFGDTMSIVKTETEHPDALKAKFLVFDIIPRPHWESNQSAYTAKLLFQRKSSLMKAFNPHANKLKYVELLPFPLVYSAEQAEARITKYMAQGYEGCVLKFPKSPYVYKRSNFWLKFKPQETADLEVYDAVAGKKGTRLENTLGALLCKGTVNFRGTEYKVKVSVGGGLPDEWRKYFWGLYIKGRLPGTIVEVKYQDCTAATLCGASQISGSKYSLRFPRFMRLRDDK